jgi:uncharacterized protein with GYD domain
MAYYLIEGTYTAESWAAQIETQESVADRMTRALDACGARLESVYYAFGDVDLVAIVDFKQPEDAAAYSLTVAASGIARVHRTTPLLSVDQGIESMRRASELRKSYSPPSNV